MIEVILQRNPETKDGKPVNLFPVESPKTSIRSGAFCEGAGGLREGGGICSSGARDIGTQVYPGGNLERFLDLLSCIQQAKDQTRKTSGGRKD